MAGIKGARGAGPERRHLPWQRGGAAPAPPAPAPPSGPRSAERGRGGGPCEAWQAVRARAGPRGQGRGRGRAALLGRGCAGVCVCRELAGPALPGVRGCPAPPAAPREELGFPRRCPPCRPPGPGRRWEICLRRGEGGGAGPGQGYRCGSASVTLFEGCGRWFVQCAEPFIC